MRNCLKYFALSFFLLLDSAYASSLSTDINDTIKQYLTTHTLNATYLVYQNDKVISKGSSGYFSIEDKKHLKHDQAMPIASGTKPITAAAILLLQDRGLLNVEDPIIRYLPKDCGVWPDNKPPAWASYITLHHLLTHTSGLTEYVYQVKIDARKPMHQIKNDIVAHAVREPLKSQPGEKHSYSGTGFIILGLVIEHVTNQSVADFFQTEFFGPLGMNNTSLASLEECLKYQRGEMAHIYPSRYFVTPTESGPKFTPAKTDFIFIPYADGGVISTTEDLYKWNRALHGGMILSERAYNQMIKQHVVTDDKSGLETYHGYGIFVSKLSDGQLLYHHSGNAAAVRSECGYVPMSKLGYVILSNTMMIIPDDMKGKIDLTSHENQIDISYFRDAILKTAVKQYSQFIE